MAIVRPATSLRTPDRSFGSRNATSRDRSVKAGLCLGHGACEWRARGFLRPSSSNSGASSHDPCVAEPLLQSDSACGKNTDGRLGAGRASIPEWRPCSGTAKCRCPPDHRRLSGFSAKQHRCLESLSNAMCDTIERSWRRSPAGSSCDYLIFGSRFPATTVVTKARRSLKVQSRVAVMRWVRSPTAARDAPGRIG